MSASATQGGHKNYSFTALSEMQGFPGQQLSTGAFSVTINQLYRHQQNLSQVCQMMVNLQSILTSHYKLINLMLPKHSSLRKTPKKLLPNSADVGT